jgi:hypothetical protein
MSTALVRRYRRNKKRWAALLVAALPMLAAHQVSSTTPETRESHAGPADVYPKKDLTPGEINPNITQQNIEDTIHRW